MVNGIEIHLPCGIMAAMNALRAAVLLGSLLPVAVIRAQGDAGGGRFSEAEADVSSIDVADDGFFVRLRALDSRPGVLGYIPPNQVEDPLHIRRLIAELSQWTRATGSEAFEIAAVTRPEEGNSDRFVIRYRQVVSGLPVGAARDIQLSRNGMVLSVESALVDPAALPDVSARMSEQEAFATAVKALEIEFGAPGGFDYEHLIEQDDLSFMLMQGAWRTIWRAIFMVSVLGEPRGIFWVTVDVNTGETTIVSAAFQ